MILTMTKGIFIPNMNKDKTTQYSSILSKHFFPIQYEKVTNPRMLYSYFSSAANFLKILKAQLLILKSLFHLAIHISTNVNVDFFQCFSYHIFNVFNVYIFIPSPDYTSERSLCNDSLMIRNVHTTSRRHRVSVQALFSFISGVTSK